MAPPYDEPRDDDRARVIEALGPSPAEIDDIIRHTGVAAANGLSGSARSLILPDACTATPAAWCPLAFDAD